MDSALALLSWAWAGLLCSNALLLVPPPSPPPSILCSCRLAAKSMSIRGANADTLRICTYCGLATITTKCRSSSSAWSLLQLDVCTCTYEYTCTHLLVLSARVRACVCALLAVAGSGRFPERQVKFVSKEWEAGNKK